VEKYLIHSALRSGLLFYFPSGELPCYYKYHIQLYQCNAFGVDILERREASFSNPMETRTANCAVGVYNFCIFVAVSGSDGDDFASGRVGWNATVAILFPVGLIIPLILVYCYRRFTWIHCKFFDYLFGIHTGNRAGMKKILSKKEQ